MPLKSCWCTHKQLLTFTFWCTRTCHIWVSSIWNSLNQPYEVWEWLWRRQTLGNHTHILLCIHTPLPTNHPSILGILFYFSLLSTDRKSNLIFMWNSRQTRRAPSCSPAGFIHILQSSLTLYTFKLHHQIVISYPSLHFTYTLPRDFLGL